MQKQLNLKVKYRESFRPFAPSILRENVKDWYEKDIDSPYMLMVSKVKKEKRLLISKEEEQLLGLNKLNITRSQIPAVTHLDYSSRIQTVKEDKNFLYHALISKFKQLTGCPLIINTSFNIRGEPIVCSPSDAFKCFMGTELDVLAIGSYILLKEKQDMSLKNSYQEFYELD